MATGGNIALPEPLEGEDAKSWFKRYEVCGTANGWNDQKNFHVCQRSLRVAPGQYTTRSMRTGTQTRMNI